VTLLEAGGDSLALPSGHLSPFPLSLPLLGPGEEAEIKLSGLVAPATPGLYTAFFRAQTAAEGRKFGHRLWVTILVVDETQGQGKGVTVGSLPTPPNPNPNPAQDSDWTVVPPNPNHDPSDPPIAAGDAGGQGVSAGMEKASQLKTQKIYPTASRLFLLKKKLTKTEARLDKLNLKGTSKGEGQMKEERKEKKEKARLARVGKMQERKLNLKEKVGRNLCRLEKLKTRLALSYPSPDNVAAGAPVVLEV